MTTIQPTVSMTEPPEIPELYRATVRDFLQALWRHYRWHMQEQFGFYNLPVSIDVERTILADTLGEIARCADGQITDGDALAVVYEGIQGLMEMLFAVPGQGSAYEIPDRFWESELGQLVATAMLRIRGDELITIAEAAEIRGVSVQAMSQAIAAGRLRAYHDPSAPRRQGRRLVSRQEVERMGSDA